MSVVTVFGASGYVGSNLVPELIAAGHSVRAVARSREILNAREWRGVELYEADVLDKESLHESLTDCDIAIYLIHSMGAGKNFEHLDRVAADNFSKAAADNHVSRIIYLGGIQPSDEGTPHLRSRAETGKFLRRGSVPVTELRAGMVVGAGSAAFEVIRDIVYHLPVMITPKWVNSRSQPIALDALLWYLVKVIETPETAGNTYNVIGPEVLKYKELIHQFAESVGLKRHLIPVPVISPRLSSYWLDLVTAVPANVARPLIDGLKHDLIADETDIQRILPRELTSYKDAIHKALEGEKLTEMPARWTEGAIHFGGFHPEYSFYSKKEIAKVHATVRADSIWSVVQAVGANNGWYALNWLWQLRGILDRLIGGVGMRRGRRHPSAIRVGDAIDFWRVVAVEPGRRLTLLAEMKLPGSAVLEFGIDSNSDESSLTTSAYFHPAGVFGLLYWYILTPIHPAIFRGMTQAIVRQAVANEIATDQGKIPFARK